MKYLSIILTLFLVVGCVSSKSTQIIGDPIPAATISNENLHEYDAKELATAVAVRDSIVNVVESKKDSR